MSGTNRQIDLRKDVGSRAESFGCLRSDSPDMSSSRIPACDRLLGAPLCSFWFHFHLNIKRGQPGPICDSGRIGIMVAGSY